MHTCISCRNPFQAGFSTVGDFFWVCFSRSLCPIPSAALWATSLFPSSPPRDRHGQPCTDLLPWKDSGEDAELRAADFFPPFPFIAHGLQLLVPLLAFRAVRGWAGVESNFALFESISLGGKGPALSGELAAPPRPDHWARLPRAALTYLMSQGAGPGLLASAPMSRLLFKHMYR